MPESLSARWRAIVNDPRFAEFEGLAPTCRVVLVADLEAALAIQKETVGTSGMAFA